MQCHQQPSLLACKAAALPLQACKATALFLQACKAMPLLPPSTCTRFASTASLFNCSRIPTFQSVRNAFNARLASLPRSTMELVFIYDSWRYVSALIPSHRLATANNKQRSRLHSLELASLNSPSPTHPQSLQPHQHIARPWNIHAGGASAHVVCWRRSNARIALVMIIVTIMIIITMKNVIINHHHHRNNDNNNNNTTIVIIT